MNPFELIARNTRDGHTGWQNVANQLGRSVDSVRAQFDPTYLRAHIWAPTREPEPVLAAPEDEKFELPELVATNMRMEILAWLAVHTGCSTTMAARLNRPINSIRARLSKLQAALMVCHDGRYPHTWSLTQAGRDEVTRCAKAGMKAA